MIIITATIKIWGTGSVGQILCLENMRTRAHAQRTGHGKSVWTHNSRLQGEKWLLILKLNMSDHGPEHRFRLLRAPYSNEVTFLWNLFFLINTVFILFSLCQTLSQALSSDFLGRYRKRNIRGRQDTKELWEVEMETAASHGKEDEKGHH